MNTSCSKRLGAALLVVAAAASVPLVAAGRASAASPVVVSLTFDDTLANQAQALPAMDNRGYKGTFYVNSPRIGTAGYFSLSQLRSMQAAGHEIGGHTLHHPKDLTALTEAQQRDEICTDRQNLLSMGFKPVSFAYPHGRNNGTTKRVTSSCGYNSGRDTNGIGSTTLPYAEILPPKDVYMIHSFAGSVNNTDTAATLLAHVDNARSHGGGWLPFIFHNICSDDPGVACPTYGIRLSTFNQFIDGLASRGVNVRTVQSVLPLDNSSLEADLDNDQIPDCWQLDATGTNSATSSRTTDVHSGAYAWEIKMTSRVSGDRKLMVDPRCALTVPLGTPLKLQAWYKGTAPVQFAVYDIDGSGNVSWWASSSTFDSSSGWKQVAWTTPGTTSTKVGFAIAAVGTGTTEFDDLALTYY